MCVYTPQLSCGLLPGILREYIMERFQVTETIICMLIILLNKKAKLYSEIIMKISKQYLEEQKQLSGKK